MVGRTITHYRIVDELGRGGMGVVYVAEDTKLGRKVAIKMLTRDVTGDRERVERFIREAQAASAVNHPNIATIYEIDEADGATFIAMELVEGQTLRACMDAGLPSDAVLDISLQVCVGLAKAHELGIIHRDIKPENVIVRPDGIAKILDFGLAKLVESSGDVDDTGAMELTQAGAVVGTARYMSPEQAQGSPVDVRSDVFSVGALLYEMIARRPAFEGQNRMQLLYAVVNSSPQPIQDTDGYPPGLHDILARTLAKTPSDRYANCGEVADAIKSLTISAAGAVPGARTDQAWVAATGVVPAEGGIRIADEPSTAPRHAVAVLPFRNTTGAPDADWMRTGLQEMLSSDLTHIPTIRVVQPDRLNAVLGDLKLGPESLFDDATVKSVSEFLNVDTVVSGTYLKLGPASRIDVRITRPTTGEEAHVKVESKDEAELFGMVAHIAAEILRWVETGADRDLVATMVGEGGSATPEAVRTYIDGLAKLHEGNNIEAVRLLAEASGYDDDFAMAYTYAAEALSNLGRDAEAGEALAKAVKHADRLSRPDRLFVAAREAMASGEVRKAIGALEDLTRLLPNNLGAVYELALAYELEGEWDLSTKNLRHVIELDPKFVTALFSLGRVHIKEGNCEASLDYLHRALSLNVLAGNREGEATVLNAIGLAHFWLDRHDDAIKHYTQSLEIKREIGDDRGASATLSNMAVVYQVRGEYERSVSTYQEALAISEGLGDRQGLAENLINLGTVYEEQCSLDEALDSYKRALTIESELGDKMAEILCLNDIGNLYITQGKVDDAEVYIERVLDARRQLGEKKGIAISLNCLGNIEQLRGHHDKAMSRYLEALALVREIKWRSGEAETLSFMATVMAAHGRYAAALESQREASAIYEELGDVNGLAVTVAAVSPIYCSVGSCE
jgi:tetratricopeptide (TPR) repeat protein/TolB-like protein/predicted Ser/Thr protein kinase